MKRIWTVIVLLVVLGALGGGAWWWLDRPQRPVAPQTIAVTRGNVEETVLASGTLEASTLVSVGAQVSGIIKSLDVKLGQEVKAGDLVAEIDSLDQENALRSAQASLANIKAQKLSQEATLQQARQAFERSERMLAQKIVSQADYDTAQAAVQTGEAQLAALEAQIEQSNLQVESAQVNLGRTRITAPVSGTVVAVVVEAGQTVSAQQSAPTLIKIANLDSMLIKAQISEADVTRVEPGQQVYFTILGDPDHPIKATLREVEPAPSSIATDDTSTSSDSSAIYYNGIFEVPNPDHRLRISMTAQVSIVLDSVENALVVPSSALHRAEPGRYMVQVYDPNTGEMRGRPVTVALNNRVQAAITDGLEEGELVVSGTRGAVGTQPTGGGQPPGGGFMMGGGAPPMRR